MFKGIVLCALLGSAVILGQDAQAAPADPAFGAAAARTSSATDVRWVCGPYRCAWIPQYGGPVVVHPYMRRWGPPPRPHCNYVRRRNGRWVLICP